MMCGTFVNIRTRNEMVSGIEGGMTRHLPRAGVAAIYDATMQYQQENIPLTVTVGKEYSSGSSYDWAVKGPRLLGVRMVIAESPERIRRSNLIGMGILLLEFLQGVTRKILGLTGERTIDTTGLQNIKLGAAAPVGMVRSDGCKEVVLCCCRIDTMAELTYYQSGSILHYVIHSMLSQNVENLRE